MVSKQLVKKTAGFTLVEILGVIAVIAILAGLILPVSHRVVASARKTQAMNNLRQIALAASASRLESGFSYGGSRPTTLAEFAHRIGLEQTDVWVVKDDPLIKAHKIAIPKRLSVTTSNLPISFAVVTPIPEHAEPMTTPIAWTRGLQADGKWSAVNGVYGSAGGFIAFLDGHVEWFTDLSENGGLLQKFDTPDSSTADINQAIASNCSILEYKSNP